MPSTVVTDPRGCSARGVVTAVGAGRVEVEFVTPSHCTGCDGACAWYGVTGRRPRAVLATHGTLAIGTAVSVAMPSRHWVLAAVVVYGWPLAALLAGAVLGFAIVGTDLGTAVGAAVGLGGAAALARPLRRHCERVALRSLVVEPVD